jgi:hypothetical protein
MSAGKGIALGLIGLGISLFLIGLLFEKMRWPDLWKGIYSGPIVLGLGLVVLLIVIKFERKNNGKHEL